MPIAKGDQVRQIMPEPFEGEVISKQFDEDEDAFRFLVERPSTDPDDEDGVEQRWFTESEIEEAA